MLHLKKKAVLATAAGIGAVAIGTGAWAYVTTTGSGGGTANAAIAQGTLSLSASASIDDLDTPADVTVTGTSSKVNRHINSLQVALDVANLPSGCDATWFTFTNGNLAAPGWAGYTFTTTTATAIPAGVKITLNNANAAQDACLVNNLPLKVTAS